VGDFRWSSSILLRSPRRVTDIDILVRSQDLKEARSALEGLNVEGFDVGKGAEMKIGRAVCRFFLEEIPAERIQRRELFGIEVPVIPVEDNIIFKAFLQRGKEEGKHDIEDIHQMIKHEKTDVEYLRERMQKCGCEERVKPILQTLIQNSWKTTSPT
jgi:predicted nucleotidyltransferase